MDVLFSTSSRVILLEFLEKCYFIEASEVVRLSGSVFAFLAVVRFSMINNFNTKRIRQDMIMKNYTSRDLDLSAGFGHMFVSPQPSRPFEEIECDKDKIEGFLEELF